MLQRVRIPHRGQSPSSATQLPITDSTSREVSYSVRDYHTPCFVKSK